MKRQYEKLIVWREAHALCISIHSETQHFPAQEKFGLISQMRRSAYGVPMNLAEGNSRYSSAEKRRFAEIAAASLDELHYQCLLAKDLSYMSAETFDAMNDRIQRVGYLLAKFRSSLVPSSLSSSSSQSSSSS